jgi:hypothetical protein
MNFISKLFSQSVIFSLEFSSAVLFQGLSLHVRHETDISPLLVVGAFWQVA